MTEKDSFSDCSVGNLISLFFFSLFCFNSITVSAQTLTAHIPQAAGAPYLLSQHRLHKVDTLASGRFDANGYLKIQMPEAARKGVFRLKWPQAQIEGLWDGNTTRFKVPAQGEPEILEGEAWKRLLVLRKSLWDLRQQQTVLMQAHQLFQDDAQWQALLANKRQLLQTEEESQAKALLQESLLVQEALRAEWNFIGRDAAFFRRLHRPEAALEAIDFTTPAAYFHPATMQHIVEAFNLYMEQPGVPATLLGLQFVQRLMDAVEHGDPVYFDPVADFLRVGLEQMNQVPALQYLAGRVAEQESCSDTELRSRLEAQLSTYLRITPGNTPPLLDGLVDRAGQPIQHQPSSGLYIFWSTQCTHCQEQLPLLYQRWQAADAPKPIYTVSIGGDAQSWQRLTADWPEWTHWRDPKNNEGPTVQNYLIYATPFIVEVEETGKIGRVYRSAEEIKW